MRRGVYELKVGQPQVIIREIDGVKCEPIESLIVDVPAEGSGKVIELVTQRKGEMKVMEPKGDLQHLEFEIPSRGIIGLRNAVLTATAGQAIMAHRFHSYEHMRGDIPQRMSGVLISMDKDRSEERRVGQACVRPGSLRGSRYSYKKIRHS